MGLIDIRDCTSPSLLHTWWRKTNYNVCISIRECIRNVWVKLYTVECVSLSQARPLSHPIQITVRIQWLKSSLHWILQLCTFLWCFFLMDASLHATLGASDKLSLTKTQFMSNSYGMVHECSFTDCSFTSNIVEWNMVLELCGTSRDVHNTLRRRGCMRLRSSTTQLMLLNRMCLSIHLTIPVHQSVCLIVTPTHSLARTLESFINSRADTHSRPAKLSELV